MFVTKLKRACIQAQQGDTKTKERNVARPYDLNVWAYGEWK